MDLIFAIPSLTNHPNRFWPRRGQGGGGKPLVAAMAAEEGGEGWGKINAFSPFFEASGNKNIGATIRISREIWYLQYAGFFIACFTHLVWIFV